MRKNIPDVGKELFPRGEGRKMATVLKLEDLAESAGERCADFLKEQYNSPRAKRIARDLQCSPVTAQKFLDGKLPGNKHLFRLAARFGLPFIEYIYAPAVGWHGTEAMKAELEETRRRSAEIERRLNELQGSSSSDPEGGHMRDRIPMLPSGSSLPETGRVSSSDARSSFSGDED